MIKYIFIRIKILFYYLFYGTAFKKLGFKARVFYSVRIHGHRFITILNKAVVQRHGWLLALKIDDHDPVLHIGEGTAIGDFCHITAVRQVIIEDKVLIANKVYISDNIHTFEDVSVAIIDQPVAFKNQVIIKSGAWIGENVCIIGASVGQNSVVGANSVVTKDIPDFCVAVGSPAKVIKQFDPKSREWHSLSNNI